MKEKHFAQLRKIYDYPKLNKLQLNLLLKIQNLISKYQDNTDQDLIDCSIKFPLNKSLKRFHFDGQIFRP